MRNTIEKGDKPKSSMRVAFLAALAAILSGCTGDFRIDTDFSSKTTGYSCDGSDYTREQAEACASALGANYRPYAGE